MRQPVRFGGPDRTTRAFIQPFVGRLMSGKVPEPVSAALQVRSRDREAFAMRDYRAEGGGTTALVRDLRLECWRAPERLGGRHHRPDIPPDRRAARPRYVGRVDRDANDRTTAKPFSLDCRSVCNQRADPPGLDRNRFRRERHVLLVKRLQVRHIDLRDNIRGWCGLGMECLNGSSGFCCFQRSSSAFISARFLSA